MPGETRRSLMVLDGVTTSVTPPRRSLDGEASHQLGLLLFEVVVGHAAVVEALVKGPDRLEQPGRGRFAIGCRHLGDFGLDSLAVERLVGGIGALVLPGVALGCRLLFLRPLPIPLAEAGPPPAQRALRST